MVRSESVANTPGATPNTSEEDKMKRIFLISLSTLGFAFLGIEANAQSWPAKPIRAIVGFPAGGIVDVLTRVVCDQLSPRLRQPIIVENRTGAGGNIATAFVAKSDPDGHTLLVHSAAHTIAPSLQPNLTYDPARDFSAVVPLGVTPNVLVVSPTRGFKTVRDLVAAAKAKPGSLTFASAGVGSGTHLSAERFRVSAGIELIHIPFRGTPEMITEVMAGRIDFFVGPIGIVLPQVQVGQLLALAVNSPKRAAALPNVPTMSEAGLVDAEYPNWFGVFLPAKTSRNIVNRLHDETLKALREPTVESKLATLGVDPLVMTPAEFDEHVKAEMAINATLVKISGIKPN
jgi:tripartite-type tricarboxylate transporter receptor subunit TctC